MLHKQGSSCTTCRTELQPVQVALAQVKAIMA